MDPDSFLNALDFLSNMAGDPAEALTSLWNEMLRWAVYMIAPRQPRSIIRVQNALGLPRSFR